MAEELSYVIITPHTLSKSRTGGVLSRLLTRTGLEWVGASMFAPSKELTVSYAQTLITEDDPHDSSHQKHLQQYVLDQFAPDPVTGLKKRVMVLLFKGEKAIKRTRDAVGLFRTFGSAGETVRDTYGDLIYNADGSLRYFEPAALAAPSLEEAKVRLKIWANHLSTDGGILGGIEPRGSNLQNEKTLVILKPDNFQFPNGRPGNIIDMFSRAGLTITCIKMHRMSVAEAEAFYSPIRSNLHKVYGSIVAERTTAFWENDLGLKAEASHQTKIAEMIGVTAGDHRFAKIVEFMSGRDPRTCSEEEKSEPGIEKCIVLVYEGVDAVRRIREVLGPTDPAKAPPGSIRREFGQSLMVNAAHASDSVENAEREMGIVKAAQNNFKTLVEGFYGGS
jgi:nucleoside diphosphate kinase